LSQAGTIELPLFPLSTVLFPGTPVQLHVYEPRYRALVAGCIEREEPFGVVYAPEGQDPDPDALPPDTVGCTARIREVEPLDEGRMNVSAVGGDRFRLAWVRVDPEGQYLVGRVELVPLTQPDAAVVVEAPARPRRWVARYLAVLTEASQGDYAFHAGQLPSDPVALGYLAASILPVPARQKQPLLAVDRASDLIVATTAIYQRELSLLENMVAHMHVTPSGPFSRN
jgi:uncharacterized protein